MNEYEIMIQRFDCDFQLELEEEVNISKEIKKENKELLKDIELLNKLAYLIRHGKARIEVEDSDNYDKYE